MRIKAQSIRPFIGAQAFEVSRKFYAELGFTESQISDQLSYFHCESFGFYLQDAYVKDWIDNTMVFMEVENVEEFWESLLALDLTAKFPTVKLVPIRTLSWGKECFLHDPSGILWHIGTFSK